MINNYRNKYNSNCKLSNSWFGDHLLGVKHNDIEMYEIYLPTYREVCYDKCSDIDKKLWLFGATSFEEMHDNVKDDSNLYIVEELERLSMNDFFTYEYDREAVNKKLMNSLRAEGFDEGIAKGIEQGKKEGIEQGKKEGEKTKQIEIAKKMLNKNTDIDFIIECTGLTKEELERLK